MLSLLRLDSLVAASDEANERPEEKVRQQASRPQHKGQQQAGNHQQVRHLTCRSVLHLHGETFFILLFRMIDASLACETQCCCSMLHQHIMSQHLM